MSKGSCSPTLSKITPNGNNAIISTDILSRNEPSLDLGVFIMTVERVRVSYRLTVYFVDPLFIVSSSLKLISRFDTFTNTNMWNNKCAK